MFSDLATPCKVFLASHDAFGSDLRVGQVSTVSIRMQNTLHSFAALVSSVCPYHYPSPKILIFLTQNHNHTRVPQVPHKYQDFQFVQFITQKEMHRKTGSVTIPSFHEEGMANRLRYTQAKQMHFFLLLIIIKKEYDYGGVMSEDC